MTLGLTYAELKALRPCAKRLATIRKMMGGARKWTSPVTAAQARKHGATLDDVMWAASMVARSNLHVERRLRLWLADCAAHVLHIYERKYPADDRPREAITTSRAFARGEINAAVRDAVKGVARDAAWAAAAAAARDAAWAAAGDAERDTAWAAAWAAARAADAARDAAWAASDAAWAAASDAASDAARDAAWDAEMDTAAWNAARAASAAARTTGVIAWDAAASNAAWAAARDAACDAARATEQRWQYDRLVLWLGEDEPEDWPLPALPAKLDAA